MYDRKTHLGVSSGKGFHAQTSGCVYKNLANKHVLALQQKTIKVCALSLSLSLLTMFYFFLSI